MTGAPAPARAAKRHLTYCTNIHAGESWDEVRDNLARYVVPVRERFAPGEPFGLGLRLSGESARAQSCARCSTRTTCTSSRSTAFRTARSTGGR